MKHNRRTILLAGLLVLLSGSHFVAYQAGKKEELGWSFPRLMAQIPAGSEGKRGGEEGSIADLNPIEYIDEAFIKIKENYYGSVKDEDLTYGAVEGMAAAVDDPYTRFMHPREVINFDIKTRAEFEGIGAELTKLKDRYTGEERLTVIRVLPGNPAEREGLQPMDQILKIDGKPTDKMILDEAVSLIRGPRGTKVTLTIARQGFPEPFDVVLTRELIPLHAIEWKMLSEKVGYIRVKDFNEKAAKELDEALESLKKEGMKGLILDVRNNPGGLLDAALAVTSRFVKSGVVVIVKEKGGREDPKEATGRDYRGLKVPMLVLVNELSASASEIVAGALRDHRLAKIVGQKTFGKGSVQTVLKLDQGGALVVTTARYLTPLWYDIQEEKGIKPDVEIKPDVDTKLASIWEQRAKEHAAAGQIEDAIHCIHRARSLMPTDERLKEEYNKLAKIALKSEKKPEQDEELQKAVEILKEDMEHTP